MASLLKADVKEYIPSWARKPPAAVLSPPPPPPPLPRKTGFTTSMTSTNVVTTHGSSAPVQSSPLHATSAAPLRSPTTALFFPTRMSPVHAAFPSASPTMNPDAKDFIPNLSSASLLATLPTSTAELAEEQERQQKQQSCPHSSGKYATTLTNTIADNNNNNSNSSSSAQATGLPVFKTSFTPPVTPIVVDKTEEEILEISKRSSLKVGAAAFIPRRTLNRIPINKPSPFSLTPTAADMSLGDLWCLFYMPVGTGESIRESTYDPVPIFRIDSVATFWKVFNNVSEPTGMGVSTLYFFRDGINPKWEDPGNVNGGIVKIKLDHSCINDAWVLLLCRTVGESWSKSVRNTVNGVAIKVRERAYLLEVWVTKQSPELLADISELFHPLLGATFLLRYSPHSVTQERAAAASAALAEKEKRNRNNRHHR